MAIGLSNFEVAVTSGWRLVTEVGVACGVSQAILTATNPKQRVSMRSKLDKFIGPTPV